MTTRSIGRWCTIFKKSGASRRSVFVVKSQGGKMCRICGLRELLTFTMPAERFSFRYSMNFFCSASVCVCTSRSSVPHGSATIVQQVEGFSICSATLSSYKIELLKCRKNIFPTWFCSRRIRWTIFNVAMRFGDGALLVSPVARGRNSFGTSAFP